MGKEQALLPMPDIIAELRRSLSVQLVTPDLSLESHTAAVSLLNQETAAAGQVSIETDRVEPDSVATERAWAEGAYGTFRLMTQAEQVVGAVWDVADTHVSSANAALEAAGQSVRLSPDASSHREASSCVLDSASDGDQADFDGTLLYLADAFGLGERGQTSLETVSVYMDGVEPSDLKTMRKLGFTSAADGVAYEGVDEPCTVFVATKPGVEAAIIAHAKHIGITVSPNPSGSRK